MFQTPSERGGIPLGSRSRCLVLATSCFKPLQSGAGFLCHWQDVLLRPVHVQVSNPFRAGRDSSEKRNNRHLSKNVKFQTPSERGGIPLQQV